MSDVKLPDHWEMQTPAQFDFNPSFIDSFDFRKPAYLRKDRKAMVYHNEGENENSPYQFGVSVEFKIDGREYSDGDCGGKDLLNALKIADEIVEYYQNYAKEMTSQIAKELGLKGKK